MLKIQQFIVLLLVVMLCGFTVKAHEDKVAPLMAPEPPLIQIAILLDNSGSMQGLINQARSELWAVVNEFVTAKKAGLQPKLQVALYKYGNPPAQMILPFTDDLDTVSDELFKLQINGGSEYCGQVIDFATRQLSWSTSPDDLKLIFIAGNEPFTQGPVDYRQSCQAAIAKGIIVNTIHCGDGIPEGWLNGAALAEGRAMNINSDKAVVFIAAPQDKLLAQLGVELNKTYVPYGAGGHAGITNQGRQDLNSVSISIGNSGQRAVTKANSFYRNSGWDLVDALRESTVEIKDVDKSTLPEMLQQLNVMELTLHVKTLRTKRTEIQNEINALNKARMAYVAEERAKQKAMGDDTLDLALISAIREQAIKKDFILD